MVRGDQHGAASATDGIQQPSDAAIDGGNGFGGRVHHAGVPHHVGVGVVDHDQAVRALVNRSNAAVRELVRRHGG